MYLPLSKSGQIIPGVTLEDVRQALSRAVGPTLSEMLQTQRDPKV